MLRADTTNFNRLLTTLGLLSLLAALGIPYFYFRSTDILRIPATELGTFTDTGRNAIAARQDAITALEPWVVGVSIALAAIGVTLVVCGAVGLRKRQKSEEEEGELRKAKTRAEVRRLSSQEHAQRVEDEAKQTVQEAVEPQAVPPTGTSGATKPQMDEQMRLSREAINRIEGRLSEVFKGGPLPDYDFVPGVAVVGSSGEEVQLDGVFEPTHIGATPIILELKVFANPLATERAAQNNVNAAIAAAARYQAITGEPASVWLLVVFPEHGDIDNSSPQYRQLQDLYDNAIATNGAGTVIHERDVARLPVIFTDLVQSGDLP